MCGGREGLRVRMTLMVMFVLWISDLKLLTVENCAYIKYMYPSAA